ncbi:sulfotransferase family protein [Actinocorallia herbida]|uniref:Sulfotransferase family protein n=1 Tax=Actinocorallia herbida TaxID=58109 RepID=A0A3N1DCK4_9ACTN|nr:sulfotransferase [Actinocorallia herbida]ROO91229.1 sulfotransferase family protein [Actinocorallia herbida]
MIIFVSGFNRSGTTVLLEAVAAASGGTPFTVGDLIRHGSPGLSSRLTALVEAPEPVDRGVDARPVTGATPEEYGWLLVDQKVSSRLTSRFHPRGAGLLRRIAAEIEERAGVAVLKNPSDTGREALLLESFPDAKIILSRRPLSGIYGSADRALARGARSTAYGMALTDRSLFVRLAIRAQLTRPGAAFLSFLGRWNLRLRVFGMLRATARLPLDRVAFLDYEELVHDPETAAVWAAHVLDPDRLAKEFSRSHSFPGNPRPPSSRLDRYLDARWHRLWTASRTRQLSEGILPIPAHHS